LAQGGVLASPQNAHGAKKWFFYETIKQRPFRDILFSISEMQFDHTVIPAEPRWGEITDSMRERQALCAPAE
jgi:hypothetical protein